MEVKKTKLDLALEYAQRGWAVFPLKPGEKVPYKGTRGFLDATKDPEQIRQWWTEKPDSNIGIATGDVSGGLTAIDIDTAEGKDGLTQFKKLAKKYGPIVSAFVVTWSGGIHQLVICPGARSNVGVLAPHIDIRGNGGYIVAAGSMVNGKEYIWGDADMEVQPVNKRWQDLILGRIEQKDKKPSRKVSVEGKVRRGARDVTLYKAACSLRAQGFPRAAIQDALLTLNREQCVPPLDERTVIAKVESAMKNASDDDASLETLPKMLDRFVYIKSMDEFWDRYERLAYRPEHLNRIMAQGFPTTGQKSASAQLLRNGGRQEAARYTYRPGREEFIGNEYNLWRDPEIRMRRGDTSLWDTHLDNIFTEDGREHFEAWIACLVQYPGTRIEHAPVLVGRPGCGKTVIGYALQQLVGEENSTALTQSMFQSEFNGWCAHKRLVVINEVHGFGRAAVNRFKEMVGTESELTINEKNRKPYAIPNYVNFLLMSNHEDALQLEPDDRRFWVYTSRAAAADADFIRELWDFVRDHCEWLYFKYMSYEVNPDFARQLPPRTWAKQVMINSTLSPEGAETLRLRDEGDEVFGLEALSFSDACRRLREILGYRVTVQSVVNALKATGWTKLERQAQERVGSDLRRARLWVAPGGDPEAWEALGPTQMYQRWKNAVDARTKPDPW